MFIQALTKWSLIKFISVESQFYWSWFLGSNCDLARKKWQAIIKANLWSPSSLRHICVAKYDSKPCASYQIRKIAGCACARNAVDVFPRRRFQRKPLVSDPGMYHGTCVTHVPWCMSGSLTRGDGGKVPDIPGACAPAILRILQEAHCNRSVREIARNAI